MPTNLFGQYYVTRTRPAISEAANLFPAAKDYYKLRAHILKLAYWPGIDKESDLVVDINWSWIKGLKGKGIGELRIADQIGGHRNLRAAFFVPRLVLPDDPLPRIWVLCIMAKKRQKFSQSDRVVFDCRRSLVLERYYSDAPVVPVKRWLKQRQKSAADKTS